MKNKAVVLGANYYIGLSIIRCLGRNKIPVVVMEYPQKNAYGLKSKYISEKHIVPYYKKEEKKFLEYLINYAKKQDKKPVLFPSADQYVEFIDRNIKVLSKYYLIHQTKKNFLINLMDKQSLMDIASAHNMLIPETVLVDENFEKNISKIKFPCIIKPFETTAFTKEFRKKVFEVADEQELRKYLDILKEKNIDVFVQQIIKGFDDHMYTFDFYANMDSKITHYTTAHKLRQWPINFGASVYTEQRYIPELVDSSIEFIEKIGYKGIGEIEYKYDDITKKYYLLEINVRTTNFNVMLEKIGLNMPYIAYMDIIGRPIKEKCIEYNTGRVFIYHLEDFLARRAYVKAGQLTRMQILKTLFRKKAYSIFAMDDMKPYFSYMTKLAIRTLNKVLKRR